MVQATDMQARCPEAPLFQLGLRCPHKPLKVKGFYLYLFKFFLNGNKALRSTLCAKEARERSRFPPNYQGLRFVGTNQLLSQSTFKRQDVVSTIRAMSLGRLRAALRKILFDVYAAMPSSWNTPRMAARTSW
jgi:hypothetical protein